MATRKVVKLCTCSQQRHLNHYGVLTELYHNPLKDVYILKGLKTLSQAT